MAKPSMLVSPSLSDEDAQYVRMICRKIDVPYRVLAARAIIEYAHSHENDMPQWKARLGEAGLTD